MISPLERPLDTKEFDSMDSWRVLRIMSEFVDGFEVMTSLGPSIAFFGTSRPSKDLKYYEEARKLAHKLVLKGFSIITGGAAGIMEAANRGAQEANGTSCGLCISLPTEEKPNDYIDPKFHLSHRYFFIRKVMFVRYVQAFIVFPGGYGTLDELFESLTLIQTKRIQRFPIYLIGKEYWSGLIEWLKNTVLKSGNISQSDLTLFQLTDDIEEVAEGVEKHYRKNLSLKNF